MMAGRIELVDYTLKPHDTEKVMNRNPIPQQLHMMVNRDLTEENQFPTDESAPGTPQEYAEAETGESDDESNMAIAPPYTEDGHQGMLILSEIVESGESDTPHSPELQIHTVDILFSEETSKTEQETTAEIKKQLRSPEVTRSNQKERHVEFAIPKDLTDSIPP